MKRLWASSLGMTLGLLATTGRAQEIEWRAAGTPVQRAAAVAEPVPQVTAPPRAPQPQVMDSADLAVRPAGRPRALPRTSTDLVPVSFAAPGEVTWTHIRGQDFEDNPPL